MSDEAEFRTIIEPLARHFFGEPNQRLSSKTELRFGTHGSMSIDVGKGTFYDHEIGSGGGVLDLLERMTGLHGQERFDWLEHNGFLSPRAARYDPPPRNRIEKIYDYREEGGHILFQVVRLYPKTFRQRRPDPDLPDEWRWNVQGIRQVPYRLPEIVEAIKAKRTIFIVEGEKDVDRLWEIEIPATCNAGGAGKWRSEFSQFFVGADVVVIPDNDPQQVNKETGEPMFHPDGRPKLPGQDHARVVCNSLAGSAQRVRYLDLAQVWAEMPDKGDVSDWLDRGGGGGDALLTLAEHATQWLRVASSRPKRERRQEPPLADRPPWFRELRREGDRIIADLRNVLIALRSEPGYSQAFAFDEMAQACKIMNQPPLAKGTEPGPPTPRILDPEDITRTREWLQAIGIPRIGHDNVAHAIELMARERPFHPLRDWLHKLEWDGEPQLGSWLHKYLGTPDDEYHRQIGSLFLMGMVARLFEPGCQSDYMIVLEGPQGEEKSKLCRALAGDEYFSDGLPPITGADQVRVSMHLRGKWLIEISELEAFSKTETATLKAFITRRVEKYTPKYGTAERTEPRQCLFVGTTNDDDWNRDDTGGRRFWPVVVIAIDVEDFRLAREQLFAEAVAAYREGKPWWPDRGFEKTVIAPIQAARQFEDAWTQKIHDFIALTTTVTIMEIGQSLGIETARFDMLAQKRISSILRKAKWSKGQDANGRKVWKKPQ